jgi:ElaB/YqjD/DUF883 family membrane-anchored ribosome-binding protein
MIEPQDITEETGRMAEQAGRLASGRFEDVKHRYEDMRQGMKHRYEDMKHRYEDSMRRNPGSSLLATLGTGLAVGLLLGMAWSESRRRSRTQGLLNEIQNRFQGFTRTPLRRTGSFASDGLQSLNKGLRGSEAQLEDLIRNLRSRVSSIFS